MRPLFSILPKPYHAGSPWQKARKEILLPRPPENCRSRLFPHLRHFFPLARPRRLEYGVRHVIGGEAILEVGPGRFAIGEARQEVGDLVNETVLVTDLQARHPPVL